MVYGLLCQPLTVILKQAAAVALLVCCCCVPTSLAFPRGTTIEYPESMTLRCGILHAPPFATIHEDGTYSGFQMDLLERMKQFALLLDNVTLTIEYGMAPQNYDSALNLVANDCNTTDNPVLAEDCKKFDVIIGDYYATGDRALRVDLTPAWLRSTISSIKAVNYTGSEITTLAQASRRNATVCVKDGTFYAELVMEKYPNAEYIFCPTFDICVDLLKKQKCVLYPDDEFQLRYRQIIDPEVHLTRESFNTQYIVWPMSFDLDVTTSLLFKRWIFAANDNATIDELYYNYFEKRQCPFGTAGQNCELFCHPDHGLSNLDGVCVCESTKWTGSDCSIEVQENFNHIPMAIKNLGFSMLGINVVLVYVCVTWLYIHRSTTQVSVSQPSFLLLVLLGCLISSSTIGFLAYDDNGNDNIQFSNFACMAAPWTYSIGFSITFGTLFAKILRVHRIFKSAAGMRRAVVTVRETLLIIGVVLLLDAAILIAWSASDPLHWIREVITADKFGEPLTSFGYCISDHWEIFASIIGSLHLLLLAIASYLCYETRNISTDFSQGKYVAIAMVSNLQIFIVGVPVLVIVGSDPKASFFVRSVIIWMNDLMVVVVIFGNLMYSVYTKPNISLRETIRGAANDYLTSNRSSSRSTQQFGGNGVGSEAFTASARASSVRSFMNSNDRKFSSDFIDSQSSLRRLSESSKGSKDKEILVLDEDSSSVHSMHSVTSSQKLTKVPEEATVRFNLEGLDG